MRENEEIEPLHVVPEALLAELLRGVDLDVPARRLRGSAEVQTGQSQAIIGTPCDVPEPRIMTSMVTALRKSLPRPLARSDAV
jgi:hypothetical protein